MPARLYLWIFPLTLFGLFLLAHQFSGATPYFADGPKHIQAAYSGAYVIQAPGYWLFTRIGGFTADPARTFALLNQFFASAGPGIFYFMSLKLGIDIARSRIAAFAYGSLFFLWFSGDVHSTYASQVFFPPLLILTGLLLQEYRTVSHKFLFAFVYACGAGFRPSDGIFLMPLFLYLVYASSNGWKDRIQILILTGLLCLLWFIPNQMALHANNVVVHTQLSKLMSVASILYLGVAVGSLANIARVLVPLIISFWPLLILIRFVTKKNWQIILLWSMPGLLFLLLLYMSDATYLIFSSGAFILAASSTKNTKLAKIALAVCAIWNLGFYFFAKPILSINPLALAFNYYGVKYTHFGITHEWMENPSDAVIKGAWYTDCIKTSCDGILGNR